MTIGDRAAVSSDEFPVVRRRPEALADAWWWDSRRLGAKLTKCVDPHNMVQRCTEVPKAVTLKRYRPFGLRPGTAAVQLIRNSKHASTLTPMRMSLLLFLFLCVAVMGLTAACGGQPSATPDLGREAPAPSAGVLPVLPTPLPPPGFGVVGSVTNGDWTIVPLGRTYASMVVVGSPDYDATSPPMVVRVRNAIGDSFEVRVDRADGSAAPVGDVDVHYVAVEEGVYTEAEHGVKMEAIKFVSTVTDGAESWVGESRTYKNAYTTPVVLGQVMTYNDPDFSVFWSRGSNPSAPPSGKTLFVGKHVGEDPKTTRSNETIGYIVIEAGTSTIDLVAGLGTDSVEGVGNAPPYFYSVATLATASTAIVSQAAMDGGNGGWAVLYGPDPIEAGNLQLAIDEDQINDPDRAHTAEHVAYVVFSPRVRGERLKLDAGLADAIGFDTPGGVAVDGLGNVYVADALNERVLKFSSTGAFLGGWDSNSIGGEEPFVPLDIAVDSSGNAYVINGDSDSVQVFNSRGEFLFEWGSSGGDSGQFDDPRGVAVGTSNNVYVADTFNHRVQVFNDRGEFLRAWGSEGSGDAEFDEPQGIAVDAQERIYVADTGNDRVQVFSPEGMFLAMWGSYGDDGGQFDGPEGIAVGGFENVYVADTGNSRIQVFSPSGELLFRWGSYGTRYGQFDEPQGLAVDGSGSVYVADTDNARVQIFNVRLPRPEPRR